MGWIVTCFALILAFAALSSGSTGGLIVGLASAVLVLPPIWHRVRSKGAADRRGVRWSAAVMGIFATAILGFQSYAESPEGRLQQAKREAAVAEKFKEQASEAARTQAVKEEELASGDHCLSGWDGSFPDLKTAVKASLRNPSTFEHVETVRSPVDRYGKFALIMTYRAENGFGGMNVEAAGVEVDARTCDWTQVSADRIASRLRA